MSPERKEVLISTGRGLIALVSETGNAKHVNNYESISVL
jgi:hypothetical protein